MKTFLRASFLGTILFFMLHTAFAQVGVSYHQSNLPFIGIQYNFPQPPIMAELRLSTDVRSGSFSPELVGTYSFINKAQHEVYVGLGLRVNVYEGVVMPVGLRVYPLQQFQNLGLHIEFAPVITTYEDDGEGLLFRGSWGFHYIFGRNNEE